MLTCKSAVTKPREVTEYQRKIRREREFNILLVLETGPATVDEIINRIGKNVFKEIFYHYDKTTRVTCHGHIDGAEVVERLYLYSDVRRTLLSLEKRNIVDRFGLGRNEAHLWFKL